MSIGEIAEIVTSFGLLFTAIMLCLLAQLRQAGESISARREGRHREEGP